MSTFETRYVRREWMIVKDDLILDLGHLVAMKKEKDGDFHNVRFMFDNGEEYTVRLDNNEDAWGQLKRKIKERRM